MARPRHAVIANSGQLTRQERSLDRWRRRAESDPHCKSARPDIRGEGSLTGDVVAQRISIEDGAFFKGGIDIQKPNQQKANGEAKTGKLDPLSTETGSASAMAARA